MKINTLLFLIILSINLSAQTLQKTILIDFGPNDVTNGNITSGPDINGNYWNNLSSAALGTSTSMVNTLNTSTGFTISVTTAMSTNGILNGGLLSPDAAKLGNMAIATATQDYFYTTSSGSLKISGLNVLRSYKFYCFGSRTQVDPGRITQYTFTGSNSMSGNLQTSGTNLGGTGYNGNNSTILTSDLITPNASGEISINIAAFSGGFAYLNMMKVEEWNTTVVTGVQKSIFVDFGPNDVTNGNVTTNPDANGNYWNNLTNASVGGSVSLVDTLNTSTSYLLSVTTGFSTNGILNGGLLSPDPAKLGKMAIATATQDYFFSTSSGTLKLTGLNTQKTYKFYCFGSRNQVDPARFTQYTLTGSNTMSGTLQTSGTNLGGAGYNANNSSFFISDLITPNSSGEILINVSAFSGGFAYLNMMKIEEWNQTQVDATSISVNGYDIAVSGGTSQMTVVYSPSNATPKTVSWSVDDLAVASINSSGLLTAKKNGTVTVTASIQQNGSTLTGTKLIAITNQLTDLFISGTATQIGDNIPSALFMNPVQDTGGVVNGQFEIYTTLKDTGTFKFYTTQNISNAIVFGIGAGNGTLQTNGAAINSYRSGQALIRVNLTANTYTIYYIDTLRISIMGSSVAYGLYATNYHGYAYQYNQLLNQRYNAGLGENWKLSNISVSGNSTLNLLNRWNTDLLNDTSRYVIYAVSLYNEGIISGGQPIFDQFKKNLLLLVNKARSAGKIPVITNNYPNNWYTATQYPFIKQMNLLIQQWDLPSFNLLGAADNGAGNWATGYNYSDGIHPNDSGYAELYYTLVPSLFDALNAGKPLPQKQVGTFCTMGKSVSTDQLKFSPENIVHSFTESFDVRTISDGTLATIRRGVDTGVIKIDSATGYVTFISPNGGTIIGHTIINDGQWHKITLTHYYARGQTILYNDSIEAGRLSEKLLATDFFLNTKNAPVIVDYRDWLFYRSGMLPEEIAALSNGKMLKSSLELYAPLDGKHVIGADTLVNLAQSTNTIKRIVLQQPVYIFIGNGNWDVASNWLNNLIPPVNITANNEVRIDPIAGGECILNIPVTFSNGAKLNILPNAKFKILSGLTINQH